MERSCQVSKDASVIIILAVMLVVNILQRNQIEELDQRITDLELADEIDTELHANNIETDDLQTMAIGAIIRQMTSEKEDWQ